MFNLLKILFKSDDLLKTAYENTAMMLKEDFNMLDISAKALRFSDKPPLDYDIYAQDKKINQFERDVRRQVAAHLAVAHPVDVSAGLALISIVADVERIGDYTKNIYELATAYPRKLTAGNYEEKLIESERIITEKFDKVARAFASSDTELAALVMKEHHSISGWCDVVVRDMIINPPEDFTTSQAVTLSLYIRHLKRISSHLTNIVSSVVNPFPRIGYRTKDTETDQDN